MTKDDKFYLLNGEEVEVPFMYRGPGTHLYGSFDGFKVLKLPYKNKQDQRQFSIYFYLPDERDGLKNLLQQLNPNSEFLKHQLMLKKERIRNIRIPKFKFPYDFDVSKVIESLGMTQPSIVLHSPDGNEVVVLGPATAIEHKAYTEMGTEAAAVTSNCLAGCAQFQKTTAALDIQG
ncbi:serpin-ZX [Quercus suber]|nr:serpin-ZX-like [Quercus suber]POE73889.1 serpin-z10 [Quercus suber]